VASTSDLDGGTAVQVPSNGRDARDGAFVRGQISVARFRFARAFSEAQAAE
jgi:hypothetical protein